MRTIFFSLFSSFKKGVNANISFAWSFCTDVIPHRGWGNGDRGKGKEGTGWEDFCCLLGSVGFMKAAGV